MYFVYNKSCFNCMFLLFQFHRLSSRSQHTFNKFHSINLTSPLVWYLCYTVLVLFVLHGKLFTTIFLEREFLLQQGFFSDCNSFTSSHPEVFLGKTCSGNMQQIYRRTPMLKCKCKLQSNFIEIALLHECSLVHVWMVTFQFKRAYRNFVGLSS